MIIIHYIEKEKEKKMVSINKKPNNKTKHNKKHNT
jgi:hypothetical protein